MARLKKSNETSSLEVDRPVEALLAKEEIAKLVLQPSIAGRKIKPIKRLTVKHRRMVALYCMGYSNKTIAEALDCNPTTVGIVLRNPTVQPLLDTAYADSQRELRALVPLGNEVIRKRLQLGDLKAVDRLYTALNKGSSGGEGVVTAEDVVERIIRIRHGDVEVTVGEQVKK